ncbi:MAG: YbaN family protein [Clostridiales bacterium]|jgi:uncharacterized membrane protein YbaN (DUF454 family)|nr:YbaN family protein [Clostridiales bacterium]
MRKKIINAILIAVGSIALVLGTIGIFIPGILPTVPFYLLTLICYSKGSARFNRRFISSKPYKKYLEPFAKTHAMTKAGKVRVLTLVTILVSIPIVMFLIPVMMKELLAVRIAIVAVLGLVILGHWIGFVFFIKTVTKERLLEMLAEAKEKEARELEEKEAATEKQPTEIAEVQNEKVGGIEAANSEVQNEKVGSIDIDNSEEKS